MLVIQAQDNRFYTGPVIRQEGSYFAVLPVRAPQLQPYTFWPCIVSRHTGRRQVREVAVKMGLNCGYHKDMLLEESFDGGIKVPVFLQEPIPRPTIGSSTVTRTYTIFSWHQTFAVWELKTLLGGSDDVPAGWVYYWLQATNRREFETRLCQSAGMSKEGILAMKHSSKHVVLDRLRLKRFKQYVKPEGMQFADIIK